MIRHIYFHAKESLIHQFQTIQPHLKEIVVRRCSVKKVFLKIGPRAYNFFKRETPTQVFP